MNIENLLEKIDLYDEMVVESGFKRDIEAYQTALGNAETQSNLMTLTSIAEDVIRKLKKIEESELPSALAILLPQREAFTAKDHSNRIQELLDDPQIETASFFSSLNAQLESLVSEVTADTKLLRDLRNTLSVYIPESFKPDAEKAIMALIFRDLETIRSLKQFAKALERWNRTLHIYHQLVSSRSPKEIELLSIHGGSLDVNFNIDVNVALDLTQVFEIGFKAFAAYLIYKARTGDIFEVFKGNKKLETHEKKTEELLLDSIKEQVRLKLEEQHKLRKKADRQIDGTSLDTKYDQVATDVVAHIVKGNDIKLLAAPKSEDEDSSEDDLPDDNIGRELREASRHSHALLKKLTPNDRKLLEDKYVVKEETEKDKK